MGMFDSVNAECPSCKYPVEFQSKAGECLLIDYGQHSVPLGIAEDLDGEYARCLNCGAEVIIEISPLIPTMVSMTVREL